ncbi:DUF4178 domain-containing protein [Aquimarina agarivorans]|uniref:DUF4178 domain-containing protein n=1 Tax=Aquimarina agarivorans TaxID=980584 RepID=UPI000248F26E|nr:DUF4178 domain-containing protein [Aquimarina agarivorans]
MGIFDMFKKKEEDPHFDPTNIKVTDLEKGYLLDYDMETWTVKKMGEYDWGDHFFSREFLIESRGKIRYLTIEEDEGLEICIFKKIKFRKLGEDVATYFKNHDKFPNQILFEGITYHFDEQSPGFYRDVDSEDWTELISFDYENDDEDQFLTIEQWGEDEFEASIGKKVKPFEISNILPVS